MKKFRNVLMFSICLFVFIFVTGCGNKTPLTAAQFKSTMEDKGYIITDATSQFTSYEYIKAAYIASSSDYKYQIEFYVLSSNEYSASFFSYNKSIFEDEKTSKAIETTLSAGNYSKYTIEDDSKYKVVSKIDTTVLYSNVDKTYKENVKTILKDINY